VENGNDSIVVFKVAGDNSGVQLRSARSTLQARIKRRIEPMARRQVQHVPAAGENKDAGQVDGGIVPLGENSMRKRILGIAFALLTVFACLLSAQTATTPQAEQKVVVVAGTRDWVSTGYTVRSGDRVIMKAMGRVYFSEDPNSPVGSNGYQGNYRTDWADNAGACEDPLPKESHACLIAKINNEIFKVGQSMTFSGKAGEIFLGINDCTLTGKFGNTGLFGVNIRVERGSVPEKK
jgi:hypothetical protein